MKKEEIDVIIKDNHLILKGEKKAEKEEKDGAYQRKECSYGSFMRVIPFMNEVVAEKAKADYKNGILKVVVAKEKSSRPGSRKLEIT
jgi:HSP20 family protein